MRAQESPTSDSTEAPVISNSEEVPRFTVDDRLRFYEQTTFAPFAFTGPVLGAALTRWVTGNPPEWEQGFRGYGRLLAGYSPQVIANSVGLAVGLAVHEDSRHYATGRHGIWKRGLCAARETFVSRARFNHRRL